MQRTFVLVGFCVGCSDNAVHLNGLRLDASPSLSPHPASMRLRAHVGETDMRVLEIHNRGGDTLLLNDAMLEGAETFSIGALPTVPIDPGAFVTLEVAFDAEEDNADATLWLASNDPTAPTTPVPLHGDGLRGVLSIDPPHLVLPQRVPGCGATREVTLSNVGDADLRIEQLQSSSALLTLPPLETTLSPGEAVTVPVTYWPEEIGELSAEVYVTTDEVTGGDEFSVLAAGVSPAPIEERFRQGDGESRASLMFYVDQSGSMADDAEHLASEADALFSGLDESLDAYRVMVITRDSGCHNNAILTPDTEGAAPLFQDALFGPGGGYTEAGLTLAHRALTLTEPGDCNDGFFVHHGDPAHLILISDELEQSPLGSEKMLDAIRSLSPSHVISTIAGDVPEGCETADAGIGYIEAAQETGGRFLSICGADWGEHVKALVEESVSAFLTEIRLAETPIDGTLSVRYDGALTNAWWYDEAERTIHLNAPPEPKTIIDVLYEPRCVP
ncbi:MAG: choice-of-anchor D domain-containing protein [Myxococcota bacterium]